MCFNELFVCPRRVSACDRGRPVVCAEARAVTAGARLSLTHHVRTRVASRSRNSARLAVVTPRGTPGSARGANGCREPDTCTSRRAAARTLTLTAAPNARPSPKHRAGNTRTQPHVVRECCFPRSSRQSCVSTDSGVRARRGSPRAHRPARLPRRCARSCVRAKCCSVVSGEECV